MMLLLSTCKISLTSFGLCYLIYSARTTRNAVQSPLLRLPTKLRGIIWTFVLQAKISKSHPNKSLATLDDPYLRVL
jgi:hypothetical protein